MQNQMKNYLKQKVERRIRDSQGSDDEKSQSDVDVMMNSSQQSQLSQATETKEKSAAFWYMMKKQII